MMRPSVLLCALALSSAAVIDITEHGAIPGDTKSSATNRAVLQRLLQTATSGDTILVPQGSPFYLQGGVFVTGLVNVSLDVRGSLIADTDIDAWPMAENGQSYAHVLHFAACRDLTITGAGGLLDGSGIGWWNRMVLPAVFGKLKGKRPKLLYLEESSDLLVENLRLHNSPSFHLQLDDVTRAEVRNVSITVDRDHQHQLKDTMAASLGQEKLLWHPKLQPWDLNTDGIDPSGKDIWIHDCSILNDDDSIAVKPCNKNCKYSDCSENMLIENMVMTGFGASIGSVPPHSSHNCVRNITFRQISMPQTGKGIYIKSNPSCGIENNMTKTGLIADITYEEVHIMEPRWWAVWIGPQQQHEPNSALGNKCSLDYPVSGKCPTQSCVDFRNITLRNIRVTKPWLSPGVILGNASNPMTGILFDNVTFDEPGWFPYKRKYKCQNAQGTVARSSPIPDCL